MTILLLLLGSYVLLYITWPLLRPRIVGRRGEAKVAQVLRRHGLPYLQDLRVLGANGTTYQIDLVTRIGKWFYVIEVKNYAGLIEGWADERFWTQQINRRSKHTFYNPLWQNYGHVKALEECLPGLRLQGVVVFTGSANFAVGFPSGVMNLRKFERLTAKYADLGRDDPTLLTAWERITTLGVDRQARRARTRQACRDGWRHVSKFLIRRNAVTPVSNVGSEKSGS